MEFAFAYYLDHKKIRWGYEVRTFQLDTCAYRPDFYIYNSAGDLVEIVEIKSDLRGEVGQAKVAAFQTLYDIPIRIVTADILTNLYRTEMPIPYNQAKRMWIDEYGATMTLDMTGERNPMYGRQHDEKTKRLIGQRASERCRDPAYVEHLAKGLREYHERTNHEVLRRPRSKRVCRKCDGCGGEFVVTEKSRRKFCSQPCAIRTHGAKGNDVIHEMSVERLRQVRRLIEDWAKENVTLIVSTPLNKITTTLRPLLEIIEAEFGITDMRTISKAMFGEYKTRKDFVKYLKSLVT